METNLKASPIFLEESGVNIPVRVKMHSECRSDFSGVSWALHPQ